MLMKHNEHGLKDAVGMEVAEMKKNGWFEYSYAQFHADVAKKTQIPDNADQPQEVVTGEDAQPASAPVKRRGRKPKGA